MSSVNITSRGVWRRTDNFQPGKAKIEYKLESLSTSSLAPTSVLIKVHAVALNYRDANIANGGNPWPTIPRGIICNDASGEVIAIGNDVTMVQVNDRVAPNTDTKNITGREPERSWLAADEEGVLANYIIFDEKILGKLPENLPWTEASTIPCAGVTAWSALKDVATGQTVLIQGTGGVSLFALKLAMCRGMKVIITSSSDQKLQNIQKRFPSLMLATINYTKVPEWDEEVLRLTGGVGADLIIEIGGNESLIKSIRCTRRGGIVSLVGYLSKQNVSVLADLSPSLIDRRIILRGINAGSKHDMDDLCAAISESGLRLDDIIDRTFKFSEAEQALDYIWQGKQVGKVVIEI